jgi:hypothetical protein
MPWYRKEQPTPFDDSPIEGMAFLHGDLLALLYQQAWLKGHKYPLIDFPSGRSRELRAGNDAPSAPANVHLFGMLELPYQATSDEAYRQLAELPADTGVAVRKTGRQQFTIYSRFSDRSYVVTYDDAARQLQDIMALPDYAMELMDGHSRALLPPLYTNEHIGMNAIAPIKFFSADSGWTWYPTEYDGDDLMFGLVSGFEIEIGYFSVSELESVRGQLGLPVERDLYYEPQTLAALQEQHRRERGRW